MVIRTDDRPLDDVPELRPLPLGAKVAGRHPAGDPAGRAGARADVLVRDAAAVGLPVLLLVPDALGDHHAGVHRRGVPGRSPGPGRSSCERARAPARGVNGVELGVVVLFFVVVTAGGFYAARWRRGERPAQPGRVGPGRPRVRHRRHLVPARRRPLHRVHLRRGAGGDVRDRRGERLLRRPVHDRRLPDHLRLHAADVERRAPARLRHAGRLRARALRQPRARAGRRGHRHPRDDALHRAAAGRHPGDHRDDGPGRVGQRVRQGPAADHRVRRARRLHLLLRAAGAGADRVRQGHADLHRDRGGDHLRRHQDRLLGHVRRREDEDDDRLADHEAARPGRSSRTSRATGRSARWRSARRSRCSCIRTR